MRYLTIPLTGLLLTLVAFFLSPILMLISLPFIKWDRAKQEDDTILRGSLPSFLSFLETPDQRLPGDLTIPSVKDIFDKYGKYITSWYWLGIRNQMMTLAIRLGQDTTDYIPEQPYGYWERGDIWRYSISLGRFTFVTGYQVYKVLDGSFKAAPVFSLKKK